MNIYRRRTRARAGTRGDKCHDGSQTRAATMDDTYPAPHGTRADVQVTYKRRKVPHPQSQSATHTPACSGGTAPRQRLLLTTQISGHAGIAQFSHRESKDDSSKAD